MPNLISANQTRYITYEQMNLLNEFRKHYLDLVIWSRALTISLKYKLDNIDAVYERLIREPYDTYQTILNFYGDAVAQQYLDLMTKQVITYRGLLEALLAKDSQVAGHYLRQMYQTADGISEFFARLSPYWDKEQWDNLQSQYLQMLYANAFAIISGNYKGEIEIFDRIVYYTNLIADYISRGIMHSLATSPPLEISRCQNNRV